MTTPPRPVELGTLIPQHLNVVAPMDGKFVVRVEVAGANPAAKGAKYFLGLDCLILKKP